LAVYIKGERQMARKYSCVPGRFYWNLEQCEEELFIALYVKTSDAIPRDQEWERRLEHFFFELGKGLGFAELNQLNAALKSRGLDPIEFRETEIGDYARSRDEQMKSQHRKQLREEFAEASPEVLAERLARSKDEERRLPPAHFTYEEFKSRRLQQDAVSPLWQEGIARRPYTRRAGDAPEVIPFETRMPSRSEKHRNFQRLLPDRTERILDAIRKLKNLSSPNYEFEEVEVEKTFDTLRERLEEAHATFRRRLTRRSRFGR
jgi:hypothetical protein